MFSLMQSCTSTLNLEGDASLQLPPEEWSTLGILEAKNTLCFKRAKIFSFENQLLSRPALKLI